MLEEVRGWPVQTIFLSRKRSQVESIPGKDGKCGCLRGADSASFGSVPLLVAVGWASAVCLAPTYRVPVAPL